MKRPVHPLFAVMAIGMGVFLVLWAVFDWEFEATSWKARALESKFGPFGMRVFRFVGGAFAIVFGIFSLLK